MKTTDPRDPLDRKIDDLLASRPLQPSDDFAARVLAAANQLPTEPATRPVTHLLRFTLPIAALIAVAVTLVQFRPNKPTATAIAATTLDAADMEEIFLLEEGLIGLSQLQDDQLSTNNLLSTLEVLTFDIES
jgi:hypothetical protein